MGTKILESYSHPMLYVNDLARAVAWYKDVLGFEARFVVPGAYASLYNADLKMRLDLHPTEADSKDVGFGAITYFTTKNVDAAVMALKERGVKVGTPRTEGESTRFVSFWDSEGNTLGLEERR
jgi:predicted enzyme related to lactoylglutathione lyase